jgi:hypothetical protein
MAPRFSLDLIRAACRDGDPEGIVNLSLAVAGAVKVRRAYEGRARKANGTRSVPSVRAGGHISALDAGNYAYRMLRRCTERQIPPPAELVDLLQTLLGQDRPPLSGQSIKREKAIEYLRANPEATTREVAKIVGVDHTTIVRWNLVRR